MITKLPLRAPKVSMEDLKKQSHWRVERVKPPCFVPIDGHADASTPSTHLEMRGIYGWYADDRGREILRRAGLEVKHGWVYIGMTRAKNRSFRQRLGEHISPTRNRDLNKTLTCVLDAVPKPLGSDTSAFMRDHLTIRVMPMRAWFFSASSGQRWIESVERQLIDCAKPCLNRTGLESTPNYRRVDELCKLRNVTPADLEESAAEAQPWSLRSLVERGLDAVRRLVAKLRTAGSPSQSQTGPTAEATDRAGALGRDRGHGHDTVQPRALTELGRFRRDFWAHVSARHVDEAPPGWAHSNVYHSVEVAGRRVSLYVARRGVGVFFPRDRGESARARAAAVKASVKWLRDEIENAEIPENGWSFLKLNSSDPRNWDRMADWLHDRRLLYERALRETADARQWKR